MGLLGRYIDELSDDQRDRIIRATAWKHETFYAGDGEPRCLVSHAVGMTEWEHTRAVNAGDRSVSFGCSESPHALTWGAFDRAVERFGLPRVVRACKLRAAKGNRITLPEPDTVEDATPETAHA